jgi:hypothetical protein
MLSEDWAQKCGSPAWKDVVKEIKEIWEKEQLKEFAFSAIVKSQTEKDKKLRIGNMENKA